MPAHCCGMVDSFTRRQRTLATNLRRVRKERGFSQEDLALEASVDRTYVSQLERGIANPSLRVMCQLADILGCQLDDLLAISKGR